MWANIWVGKKTIELESQKISEILKLNVTKYKYLARHLMTFVLQNYVQISLNRLHKNLS